MAYEFGLVCKVPPTTGAGDLIRALVDPPSVVDGPSWTRAEIVFGSSRWPATVQANVADEVVAERAGQARDAGLLMDPGDYRAVLTFSLSGDVDWEPLLEVVRSAQERWSGVLFDEACGFAANVD